MFSLRIATFLNNLQILNMFCHDPAAKCSNENVSVKNVFTSFNFDILLYPGVKLNESHKNFDKKMK